MASRKQLKKSIKYVAGELFADCVALTLCKQGNAETLQEIMTEILTISGDYIGRLSNLAKGSEHAACQQIRKEFTAKVNDLSDRIVKA